MLYDFLRLLGVSLLVLSFVGCAPPAPAFKNTDVTGADCCRDFRLTDHNGRTRTLADFRGKGVVVFFGYVHGPDVCPTTLSDMKAVIDQLGEDGKRVQVLFVTVDPERDTQALLAQYVPAFHPSFLGLYGDKEQTAKAAKEFKVFYQKSPGSTPDNYSVDHTAGSYVFDPNGRIRLFVGHGQAAGMAPDIRILLKGG
jgi:protein SCO1/2